MRHAQSTWNRVRRWQGQLDPPLSPLGCEQAQRLAVRLAGRSAGALYSSDLRRAVATAGPLAHALGLALALEPGLREIALGAWEGKNADELAIEFPECWAHWNREPSWDLVSGGEGAAAFERRVRMTVAAILDRHPGREVICVTHGGVIQAVLAGVLGRDTRGPFPFRIQNASLTVLQRSGSRTLVTAVNDTCHLAGLEP